MGIEKKLLACLTACLLVVGTVPSLAWAGSLVAADTLGQDTTLTASNPVTVQDAAGGQTGYVTVKEAVEAAPDGATVLMNQDCALEPYASSSGASYSLEISKPLTIDGQGHTLTVGGYGIRISGGEDAAHTYNITFKDITVTNGDANSLGILTGPGYKTLTLEAATLATTGSGNSQALTIGSHAPQTTQVTLRDSTVVAQGAGYGIIVFNPVDLVIDHSRVSGYGALFMKGKSGKAAGSGGSEVRIVNGSVLSSQGIAGASNMFGTIVFQGSPDVQVSVQDSTIEAIAATASPKTAQMAILFNSWPDSSGAMAKDCTVTLGPGTQLKAVNEAGTLIQGNGEANTVRAIDGSYDVDGSLFYGDGPAGTALVVEGGDWDKDVAAYVPASSVCVRCADGRYRVAAKDQAENGMLSPGLRNGYDLYIVRPSIATVVDLKAATPAGFNPELGWGAYVMLVDRTDATEVRDVAVDFIMPYPATAAAAAMTRETGGNAPSVPLPGGNNFQDYEFTVLHRAADGQVQSVPFAAAADGLHVESTSGPVYALWRLGADSTPTTPAIHAEDQGAQTHQADATGTGSIRTTVGDGAAATQGGLLADTGDELVPVAMAFGLMGVLAVAGIAYALRRRRQ